MADAHLTTASQRPPTGLDGVGRGLIAGVLTLSSQQVVQKFFVDRFESYADYFVAVDQVWGEPAGQVLAVFVEAAVQGFRLPYQRYEADEAIADSVLRRMPEADFRQAIMDSYEEGRPAGEEGAERINRICRSRGAPWRFSREHGFEWVGDQEVEEQVIRPALSALADHRFAGGVKDEFESARSELALGTPSALRQCVHQAGSAVESAMKVVLTEREIPFDPERDTATPLFDHLKAARVVDGFMHSIVLGPMTPRNRIGGHGAGAKPHEVPVEVAEAVLASAAVSIAYLGSLLGDQSQASSLSGYV